MDTLTTEFRVREIRIPDIGSFSDVPVLQVCVRPGEHVTRDMTLIVLESEKATFDVPAPVDGVIQELKVDVGDKVSEGSLVLLLDTADAAASKSCPDPSALTPASEPVSVSVKRTTSPTLVRVEPVNVPTVNASTECSGIRPTVTPSSMTEQAQRPYAEREKAALSIAASPAVRKLARTLGADLGRVSGSGPRGRVLRGDVERFIRAELARPAPASSSSSPGGVDLPPWPQIDFASFGPVERQPLSRIRRLSGANLARNWIHIPHVTNFDEADITDLETFRTQLNQEQFPSCNVSQHLR